MYEVWFQRRNKTLFKVIVEAVDPHDARIKARYRNKGFGKPIDCRKIEGV